MKKSLFLSLLTTMMLASSNAYSNVAVVDYDVVLEKSKVWQVMKHDIKEYAVNVQSEVMRQQVELEKVWDEIKKARKNENEKLIALEKSFKDGRASSQEYVQSQKKKMDTAFVKARKLIKRKITNIVKRLAIKGGFEVVVNANQIIYFNEKISLTQKVLEILDTEIPYIKLQFVEEK